MTTTAHQPTLDTIPSFDHRPSGRTEPSRIVSRAVRAAASRRSILKMVGGGAVAFGVAALELRPPAARAVEPNPILGVWGTCNGSGDAHYADSVSTCTPRSAKYGSLMCNGVWHRNDSYSGSFVVYNFTFNNTSCDQRNAWKWGGGSTSSKRRRCSDGYTSYYPRGGTSIVGFSICRTNLDTGAYAS
ncbi:MAG TPA: hypothetical protein VES93_04345 [Ornithinibacter sp.]|nr:hypothetical protein [Ornithinibacter sp.]